MTDSPAVPVSVDSEIPKQDSVVQQVVGFHQFRRDLFPSDLALSASDLQELCALLDEINENAKEIVFQRRDPSAFKSDEEARERVDAVVKVEYTYDSARGDHTEGLTPIDVEHRNFPEDLTTFFVSNATYSKRTINFVPACAVDIFLSFAQPPLKIDLLSMPSNPTENRSVINIYGLDEDWVRATETRLLEFFEKRKKLRFVIHKSGAYDYLLYLLYLPVVLLLLHSQLKPFLGWTENQPTFFVVVLSIYFFFVTLLVGRVLFQYIRWLFPPMEYYKTSRQPAQIQRGIGFTVLMAIVLPSIFNAASWLAKALISNGAAVP